MDVVVHPVLLHFDGGVEDLQGVHPEVGALRGVVAWHPQHVDVGVSQPEMTVGDHLSYQCSGLFCHSTPREVPQDGGLVLSWSAIAMARAL